MNDAIELSSYSLAELEDAAAHVDRTRFPDRAALIEVAIKHRKMELPSEKNFDERRFAHDLAVLRSRQRSIWVAWAAVIPAELIIGIPLSKFLSSSVPFTAVGLIALGAFAASGIAVGRFRCPRCGKLFTARVKKETVFDDMWYRNPFTSKCLHCGLSSSGVRPNSG